MKVRCTRSINGRYKVGKIYQVDEDGRIVDEYGNDGDENPTDCFQSWYKSCVWNNYDFELVEGSKMFTKDDLKVNDWCVFRNGSVFRVASDSKGLCMVEKDSWAAMEDFNSDLTNKELIHNLDVLRVYRPEEGARYHLIREYYSDGNLVFDREKGIGCEPPVKEISVDEATKLLTEKFGQNVRIRVGE